MGVFEEILLQVQVHLSINQYGIILLGKYINLWHLKLVNINLLHFKLVNINFKLVNIKFKMILDQPSETGTPSSRERQNLRC